MNINSLSISQFTNPSPNRADFPVGPSLDASSSAYSTVVDSLSRIILGTSRTSSPEAALITAAANMGIVIERKTHTVDFLAIDTIPAQTVTVSALVVHRPKNSQSQGTIDYNSGLGTNNVVDLMLYILKAKENYDIVTVDALGCGESGWLYNNEGQVLTYKDLQDPINPEIWLSINRVYAQVYNAENAELGNAGVLMDGHSLGGFTAQTLASAKMVPYEINNLRALHTFATLVSDGETLLNKMNPMIRFMETGPIFSQNPLMPNFFVRGAEEFMTNLASHAMGPRSISANERERMKATSKLTAQPYRPVVNFSYAENRQRYVEHEVARKFYAGFVALSMTNLDAIKSAYAMEKTITVPWTNYYFADDNVIDADFFMDLLERENKKPDGLKATGKMADGLRSHLGPQINPEAAAYWLTEGLGDLLTTSEKDHDN